MNVQKMAAALNTIAVGFGELAEALDAQDAVRLAPLAPAPPHAPQEAMPEFPPADYEDLPFKAEAVESNVLGRCPAHDRPWTVKAAGVSKAGKHYNAFFKCDGKDPDGTYCNRKPVKAWADAHAAWLEAA